MTLFTFGYEGLTIDAFIARLATSGVRLVIDVRELPLSRKRGFSKKSFAAALKLAAIEYNHIPTFGCPRPIRNRYKVDNDWDFYVESFQKYLAGHNEEIKDLACQIEKTTACLVCFESDFTRCHRSLIAQALRKAGVPRINHLIAKRAAADEAGHLTF